MPELGDARNVGRNVVGGVVEGMRRTLAHRVAEMLKRDPERLAAAVEMGLVRRQWLDSPGEGEPISVATPIEVVERFLERSVEQRPSLLSTLGLTTIQVLASTAEDEPGDGVASRMAVAFTDLEGFTRWTAEHGDDAASKLLAGHHRRVGPVVRSRGGRIVKHLGDGLLLTFPEPEAAVLACLELVDVQPEPLRLRAGVHVGDVVATRDDVIGHVVNVAARVAESAKGGQVLLSQDVCDAVGELPGVHFGRLR